ncbi:hypothetical protein HN908_01280 [Candidatus Woesearchaeota archaeon]|nr:hypothetical protein [Candidatus Woesearchaeota archaeon]
MKISLKQLESAIKKSWNRETCHYKFLWDDKDLPESAGHCRVVSLIVQDFFGGEILYSYVRGNPKWDHYWNKLSNGKEIDFTKDQFPENIIFIKSKLISRMEALSSKRTQSGYEILKKRVKSILER